MKAEESLPDVKTSASSWGSSAHEVADMCLREGGHADEFLGQIILGCEVDQEMVDTVETYLSYVRSFGGKMFPEQQVDFSPWVPGGFGTSDCIIINESEKLMRIVDLKGGKGVQVYADNNSQGMLYALGALEDYGMIYDIERVIISIVQPRLDHIDEWEVSVSDLLKWADDVRGKAQLCLTSDAPRVPGEKQCQFCKFKPRCPEQKQMAEQALMVMFDEVSPSTVKDVDALTDEHLAMVMQHKKLIEGWLSSVEKHISDRLQSGESFPGYKIVEGRSTRQWGDEEQAQKALAESGYGEDKLYTRKFVSVAQAEKLVGKKNRELIAELAVKPSGKPTVAPESDKRPAINVTNRWLSKHSWLCLMKCRPPR